jgi:cobyrinic acid a,c-diamide synthase
MGMYDGDCASTAMVAEALDLPVVLVVDAKAGMESVAATALGFESYAGTIDRDVDVVGVLAQRAHGGRHAEGIREALPDGMAWLGRIPPMSDLDVPERHLGLHMGTESPVDDEALAAAAEHVDAERLVDLARTPPEPDPGDEGAATATGRRVAVASDAAFCFTYPATLERLHSRADVVTFAPTQGDDLPACDGVYLPGGYPERFVAELADAPALDAIGRRASEGLPVLGECGGLMALAETLRTADGHHGEMAGVLPADVEMHDRYQALDHVELAATTDTLTATAGDTRRGHAFHYSSATVDRDATFAVDVVRGDGIVDGRDGLTEHRTLGTYAHLHPDSGAFDAFLESL